jgi:hypothetical protein
MRKTACFVLGFALFYGLYTPRLHSQSRLPPKLSKASERAAEKQTKQIQTEIGGLRNHRWAGEYYYGDGLGVNVSLILAPQSGFVFTWHGCLGLYDLNYGSVAFSKETLKLLFTYTNSREGFEGIAPELIPMVWGQRHYLIPRDGVIQFANAINAGLEPNGRRGGRSEYFLLKRGDENGLVDGAPPLPAEYAAYILKDPINANILSVNETHLEKSRRITSVTLDVGSATGLKKGMELYVQGPFETATITDVEERTALAIIDQFDATRPPPSVGWKFSTKLTDNAPPDTQ